MPAKHKERLYVAMSLADAIAALADRGSAGAPLAGATWIMRAPLRQERQDLSYVAISRIDELRQLAILDHEISIGACVTHAELATALGPLPECRAVVMAAGSSANPAIRQVATIGGNLCAVDFAASDLVPALTCLEAEVELETPSGTELMAVDRFLQIRADAKHCGLVRRVIIPRASRSSAHIRLPLRKAGDYPVAIVSLALALSPDGIVSSARVVVGSVEPTARRWERLEAGLIGHSLDPQRAADKAESYCGDFQGRDGIEAPGWYRVKVLPRLVRQAVQTIQRQ